MLIERLASETGLRREQLLHLAETASKRYFTFPVEKRNGQKRWIAHPFRPLKGLQRLLNAQLFAAYRIHPAAVAYQKGSSIKENAYRHVATNFTLRLDFADFFPSFTKGGIIQFLKENRVVGGHLNADDLSFVGNIVTKNDQLTIGAPSSPILTNALMYSFDDEVARICYQKGLIYTRYADDLFFSSFDPFALDDVVVNIRKIAAKFPYAVLKINEQKTAFLSRKYRRRITGLIITSDRKVSVGRARKREIKALVNDFRNGQLDIEKIEYTKGLISFAFDVDRAFFDSLSQKYGRSVISKLIGKS